ncbi:MAG: 1-acyl-sn-glycerol-3-phosphate acyltransferase [Tannerella sp.]|jgi:1-acyl-sn-glycerol-3-phosphate acyltransferase|nr:1-acyl-sn-glycerol-3-phosphate acyltransferase [Tannerella sp.]
MTHFFLYVYDFFSRRKGWLLLLLTAVVGLLTVLASQIRFKEDISGFLPETTANERMNRAYHHVISANKITVFCSGDTTSQSLDSRIAAIDRLAERLQGLEGEYIKQLTYKIEASEVAALTSFVTRNLPYFLTESDYLRMDTLFSRENMVRQLENNRNLLASPAGAFLRESILSDPVRISNPVMARLQDFQLGEQFHLHEDHIFTDNGEALLFIECTMPSSETARNAVFLDSLHRLMAETVAEADHPVSFRCFGASEIATGNASQIKKDTLFSCLLSVILVLALLMYAFRSLRTIWLVFAATLFGAVFALALIGIIRGEVSIIAVGISSIMFGIAVNYPLHFAGHYSHTSHRRTVIKDIIQPLTIGNITTVSAFLSLVFMGSDAMADLGWFASLLLIGTILFVLFFMPHLLPAHPATTHAVFIRASEKPLENNRYVIIAVLLLTVFFSFFSNGARFETNMQKINYMTAEQQQEYQRMTALMNQNRHVLYCVTEGKTTDETLALNEELAATIEQLSAAGKISGVATVSYFYPSQAGQSKRVERWNRFWESRRDSVQCLLEEEAQRLGFKPKSFQAFETMIQRTWKPVDLSHFDVIRQTLAKNYIFEADGQTMVVNLLYTDTDRASELEQTLNRIDAPVIAFDAGSITRRMIHALSGNFNYVLYVCGCIVFIFLTVSLGRSELSFLAFIPLALSWIWILGLMNLLDIRFNIINIILATFIFGQGDDYTIFITEGLMYEYTYGRKILTSYKNSIALSALIMFTGMGMLIFAHHPALRSLGEVTVIGMLSTVIMAYVLPPFLFRLLTRRKGKPRLMPVTLKNLASTVYAFTVFIIITAQLTIFGYFLFTCGGVTEKKRLLFHRLLCRLSRWVMFRIPQVQTTCENMSGETFEKPAVIICNHQSHLDLTALMMLTPKLVVLTNDWVWNSPFYGQMIKYAEFYPVSDGIDKALVQLEDVVRRGYSIVVFPEGTRSPDCSILRFHRGAFYLAERLQLDILPVLIHGIGHVLPKPEFMLRKGRIHIRIMERIRLNDARFSPDYAPRSKEIRRFYREAYQTLCCELETPDYYSDLVLHNYLYKGPTIERAVRKSLRRHRNFVREVGIFPGKDRVIIHNSGYGEFTLLLALVRKELQVVGVESDPDKRATAIHCASNPPNLSYLPDISSLVGEAGDMEWNIEDDSVSLRKTVDNIPSL